MMDKKFIDDAIERHKVVLFLRKTLNQAWLANIDIQRTPLATRVTLESLSPGRIIGRKGRSINKLTETLKTEFNITNPQINVVEVTQPYLEPRVVAKKASRYIETGKKVRSVLHYLLKEIMNSGAMGAEIVASGKIGAKGARARTLRVYAGYIPKAGEPLFLIRTAHISANTKSGIIGVLVRIVPPGTKFPDKEEPAKIDLPKVIESAQIKGRRSSK